MLSLSASVKWNFFTFSPLPLVNLNRLTTTDYQWRNSFIPLPLLLRLLQPRQPYPAPVQSHSRIVRVEANYLQINLFRIDSDSKSNWFSNKPPRATHYSSVVGLFSISSGCYRSALNGVSATKWKWVEQDSINCSEQVLITLQRKSQLRLLWFIPPTAAK